MVFPSSANAARKLPDGPRIVGLGASAGGLEALELFLGKTPQRSGLAFIVVQHLDPTQKALLPELLQRITPMRVCEAEQGMRIEANHVYVIPPNTELSVVDGVLHLARPTEPRGLRLPINVLFSSLASSQGERAVAVILSGMGSDGTLGLQAVKAVGGLTAVQEPRTAQFDSMPWSAIRSGSADIVAPPEELPVRILDCLARLQGGMAQEPHIEAEESQHPGQQILSLLQSHTRHDFSLYKPSTLQRRIGRRMAIHNVHTQTQYAEFLAHNPQEIDLLFKELLIGVTSFFRDVPVWEHLGRVAVPELLARRPAGHKFRIWSVGCSTGEEAYSLAMIFTEAAQALNKSQQFALQIFSSDLSPDAIATARRGQYPLSIKDQLSPERLERFFTAHDTYYQIRQNIRDTVLFAQHDVVLDPPFTRLDFIVCRNLLIYFDALLQRRLIPLFHYSLLPGGMLLLGSSETIGRFHQLFSPMQTKLRLYMRQDKVTIGKPDYMLHTFPPLSRLNKENPVSPPNTPTHANDRLQAAADQVLLQVYAPAAVVVNRDGDIVYISGRTGKYLEPAAGKANWNFHAMVREGLRGPLMLALKNAAAQATPVQLTGLQISSTEGLVDVTVQLLREGALRDMTMIIFRDVTDMRVGISKPESVTDASYSVALQQYQHEIQNLREEARASREELQSSNEELQSTNEELQSANEELTTSKEEMQSMNEELQTINTELQSKLDDLALAQSDLQNTLNSIEIAVLFLDQNLNVRRYTDRAARIINLRETDIGRPLSDLTTTLQYPAIHDDAHQTLRTLVFSEKEIPTDDGRWFVVRIMPYRRLDNMIDGVVITLVDITATKKLEAALRKDAES